jgi:tetraacyldisaccharide 4'-kinase
MTAAGSASRRLQAAWLDRGLLAWLLWPIAAIVHVIARLRRGAYARGWLAEERVDVPVIVVGNLIAGGAGKTPTVLAVVRWLAEQGHRPGIVSRGHGRDARAVQEVLPDTPVGESGDEPWLLRRRSGRPVVVGRDRVAAARHLRNRHPDVTVIVTDDGLQHRRLAREAEVIVFDERGSGNGWCLPAGPLREPMTDAAPQRSVVVYNAARPTTRWPGRSVQRRLAGAVELRAWLRGEAPTVEALIALRGRRVLAAAGLALPERFFGMLRDAGLTITPLPLPDHHRFDRVPWPPDTACVLVTEKDATKLDPRQLGATTVWVVPLDFALDPETLQALGELLRTASAAPTPPTESEP